IAGRNQEPLNDQAVLVSTYALILLALADGRNRPALPACAGRHFQGRAESTRISRDQSNGQGASAKRWRGDARRRCRDMRLACRALSAIQPGTALGRSSPREISLLAVFRASLP